ncbi:MFS transporter [Roseibium sp. RKSG952]|nr:MFS transporter [Roseibium sp. RKSG952]
MLAQVAGMSLWFISAATLPELIAEFEISKTRQAALSSAVPAGFVAGAILSALAGLADRMDPRKLFAMSAVGAAMVNAALLITSPDGNPAVLARFATGVFLAGVYPVGMKIVVGWGLKDRNILVSAFIAAFTFGSAAPYLIAYLGGAEWRWAVGITSTAALIGGVLCLGIGLGPYHSSAGRFDIKTIAEAWTNRHVRLSYAGYLGHMWELYAMWTWISVASAASFATTLPQAEANGLGRLTAFAAIAAGGIACLLTGPFANRIGKINLAILAMITSGSFAVLTAFSFGGPPWLTIVFAIIWGAALEPDSAQFSTLVADHAPASKVGSLLTIQTALGFSLSFFAVQVTPLGAEAAGWPVMFAVMALGPAAGTVAMLRLKRQP